MLVKVALLFLAVLAAIGWIGSLLGRPPLRGRLGRLGGLLGRPASCPACGRPRTGPGPCPCGRA